MKILSLVLLTASMASNLIKLDCSNYKQAYHQQLEKFTCTEAEGKLNMKMTIFPRDYKIADLALKGEISDAWELQESKGNELYFSLELTCPGSGQTEFLNLDNDQTTFSQRVEYYHFRFFSDIKVELDNYPVSIAGFQFERLFNISPKGKFYGVIPISKKSKKLKITIADKIYDHDSNSFEFNLQDFKKLPKLKKIKNPGKNNHE
jgi:hypothetical protein